MTIIYIKILSKYRTSVPYKEAITTGITVLKYKKTFGLFKLDGSNNIKFESILSKK